MKGGEREEMRMEGGKERDEKRKKMMGQEKESRGKK